MTSYARATDANQARIVAALRRAGCSVQLLSRVGQGCPDLLVGRLGENVLLEVKDSSRVASARRLTPDEAKWHREWRGQVTVVEGVLGALAAVGIVVAP